MTDENILRGQVIEEETLISLEELCRCSTVQRTELVTYVEEGIIEPAEGGASSERPAQWQFHVSSIRRVRTVVRLQRDLGVNLPGAALAVELLDRIDELEKIG
jgi:chaperone modulatory protein CbpM